MVTIHRAYGLRVVTFTDDHKPAHVDVATFGASTGRIPPLSAGFPYGRLANPHPKTLRARNHGTERQSRRGYPIHKHPAADRRGRLPCLPAPRYADSTRSLTRRQVQRFNLPLRPHGRPSNASIHYPVHCDSTLIQRNGFMPYDEGHSPAPHTIPHLPCVVFSRLSFSNQKALSIQR